MYAEKSNEGFLAFLESKKLMSLGNAHLILETDARERIGVVKTILELGLLSEDDVAEHLSTYLGLEILHAADMPFAADQTIQFSPRYLRKNNVLPVGESENGLMLAMLDPLDRETISMMATAIKRRVQPYIITQSDLQTLMDRAIPDTDMATTTGVEVDSAVAELADKIGEQDPESPASRFVERLFNKAAQSNASDIHVELVRNNLEVRFRVDGLLELKKMAVSVDGETVISRLKVLAGMDIAEKRLPQDGRARIVSGGREIDLRFASLPSQDGETLTIRLLSQSQVPLNLARLGFSDQAIERLRELLRAPNGLILVTGPTGSGKTTTLYAALNEKVDGSTKIMSIEDPVEYNLPGVTQVAVKPSIGLTFPSVLRSVMRHDPDVILIGEIRDQETAEIAVRAAMTGHLVLATLHANTAAGAVTRLIDIGIPRYLITAAVRGALAQRLVRRLAGGTVEEPSFSGRSVLSEILLLDGTIKQHILDGADTDEITKAALEAGMKSMATDGMLKISSGVTTLEELSRVTLGADKPLSAPL